MIRSSIFHRRMQYILTVALCLLVLQSMIMSSHTVDLELLNFHESCVMARFGYGERSTSDLQPFELSVCNGRLYNIQISILVSKDPSLIFSKEYCTPFCIVCTSLSTVCVYAQVNTNSTVSDFNYYDHNIMTCSNSSNSTMCVPVRGNKSVCYPLSEFTISGDNNVFRQCFPNPLLTSCLSCFLDIVSSHTKTIVQYCVYSGINLPNNFNTDGCQKLLANREELLLKVLKSATEIDVIEGSECQEGKKQKLDCPPKDKLAKLQRLNRINVSIGFIDENIVANTSLLNTGICISKIDDLRNINSLVLTISTSEDSKSILVLNPSDSEVRFNVVNVDECVNVTMAFAKDNCDNMIVTYSITIDWDWSKDLEFNVTFDRPNLTVSQVKSNDCKSTSQIPSLSVILILAAVLSLCIAAFVIDFSMDVLCKALPLLNHMHEVYMLVVSSINTSGSSHTRIMKSAVCTCMLVGILLIKQTSGVKFGESDVYIREGGMPRSIHLERKDLSEQENIKVYITTIEKYKERPQGAYGCNLTLTDLGIDESLDDPAEESDLSIHEFNITFGVGIRLQSLSLEVFDDDLTEYEEKLIAYTSYTTSPLDRCAMVISIVDDDLITFNFSTDQKVLISEDVGTYSNISIIKNGRNEPNITVGIDILDLSDGGVNILQMEYVFTSNTTSLSIPMSIHDNEALNGDRDFYMRFMSLWYTYRNSLLVTEVAPNEVQVTIEDNEVAVLGFINETDITIQEGGEPVRVCVGFDENLSIDESLYVIIDIMSMLDDSASGYDLVAQPLFSSGLHFTSYSLQECVDLSSIYDTNINDSVYTLSLTVKYSTRSSVTLSKHRERMNIYSSDHHGIHYKMEPRHVRTGIGRSAFFPCTYIGPKVNPLWNISYPNGTFTLVSTTRLPAKVFSNGTGLNIRDVDESYNMTGYSCLFQLFDRNDIVIVPSSEGILTILESITFDFLVNTSSPMDNGKLVMIEGDLPPKVRVVKAGYSLDSFLLDVSIKVFNDKHVNTTEEIMLRYWLRPSKSVHSIALPSDVFMDDFYPEKLTTILVNITNVEVSGAESVATIEVAEPLIIAIYDNDYYVGFTQDSITVTEDSTSEICLEIFNLERSEIHPSHRIELSLETDEYYTDVLMSANEVTLDSNTKLKCVTITFNGSRQCSSGEKNVTILAKWIAGEENINVTLTNQRATVIISTTECPVSNDDSRNIIAIVLVIISLMVIILALILTTSIWCCCKKVTIKETDVA